MVYERGTILVKISILKGKGLSLRAGPPHKKACLILQWTEVVSQKFHAALLILDITKGHTLYKLINRNK